MNAVNEAKLFHKREKGKFKRRDDSDKGKYQKKEQRKEESYKCYRCAGKHSARDCGCKNEKCHVCNKIRHIARDCRKKRSAGRTQYVEAESGNEGKDDEFELFGIYTVYTTSIGQKRIVVNVKLDGKGMDMQVDTGAAVSLISELTYKESLSYIPINKTIIQLTAYSGEKIPLLGSINVPVQYGSQNETLPLVIVKGERPALLGQNWLEKIQLDWQSIFMVEKAEAISDPE